MPDLHYYTSERFIHDGIVEQAERGVQSLYSTWKERGRIDPFFLSWPSEPVQTDDGSAIAGACALELPEDRGEWNRLMLNAVQVTRAYGVLLVEQRAQDVRVILETPHGARCWTLPVERRGDARALGAAVRQDNGQCLGILWKPGLGTS